MGSEYKPAELRGGGVIRARSPDRINDNRPIVFIWDETDSIRRINGLSALFGGLYTAFFIVPCFARLSLLLVNALKRRLSHPLPLLRGEAISFLQLLNMIATATLNVATEHKYIMRKQ